MRSVQRILAVFESFTLDRTSLALHEIADRIALPKSTTFRILHSLERAGYLVRLEDQRYCLSFRFTRLAGMVASTLGIREIARPIMVDLAQETGETVSLHTASAGMRVCLDAVAAASPLRSVTQPGEQVPLTAGSSSKVLLAHLLDETSALTIVAETARVTKRTQADVQAELAQVRGQGYAVSHGERVLGVSAVSAPIAGVEREAPYCLSVAGPTVRVQMHEKSLVERIVQAAADVSRAYGAELR